MLLPPLPNFLFQRDPSCWIFDGVTINPMTKPARKPEIDDHGDDLPVPPDVHRRGVPDLAGRAPTRTGASCHVEGGDVQPIGNGTVMIGMGERTTPQAVLIIARELFRGRARPPRCWPSTCRSPRSYMHLDTVITMCDRDLVTLFPDVVERGPDLVDPAG